MSRSLLILCFSVLAGAVVVGVLHAWRATSNEGWAVGYSADFSQEDALDPAKNCTGRIYVNCLHPPHGMRRESICGDRKRTVIFRQGGTTVVLDPDAKVYWRPEVKTRPEVDMETPRANLVQDAVNGRQVARFKKQIKQADGSEVESEVWEDPKLHAPIRVVTAHSQYELTNVREGAQAESLFTIPDEYREIAAPKN
jgi:hypothetical protein